MQAVGCTCQEASLHWADRSPRYGLISLRLRNEMQDCLQMQICLRIELVCCLYEGINKSIVVFASNPRSPQSEVKLIIQELLILENASMRRDCRTRYRDDLGMLTSVPQSSTTGKVLAGCIPAHKVVMTSLATDIKIPPTPDMQISY